jgi:hypothetical protein
MKNYLYKENERMTCEVDSVIVNHPELNSKKFEQRFKASESFTLAPGSYLIHEETPESGLQTRYLAVVGDSYTVTQMTVGAFTADNMDNILHRYRVPGVYYITMEQAQKDSAYRYYQKEYGDDVLPHIMANGLDTVDPNFKQLDPNWEANTPQELMERLTALKEWWTTQGYEPLAGIASYTPCNALVAALKDAELPILHSIIPEQNWSDGKWAINHWGMPNQPFYVASDDFRKSTKKSAKNVIAMGMNSYHLYMPHVVNWGDNVLSPSHFLRWHRSVESRYQPERYTNFMLDYLKAAGSSKEPFFLIAGYEFGRTFGTMSMSDHNRKGMERLILSAKDAAIVFATAKDVAAYYERHFDSVPEAVWTQRDYLAGTRIMGKPINSGPSIGMEMTDYKAVFEHQKNLPYYFYDYTVQWDFAYNDINAPMCFAAETHENIRVEQAEGQVNISVVSPLERITPLAIWDAKINGAPDIKTYEPAVLDDGRQHQIIELPIGFSGKLCFELTSLSKAPTAEFEGIGHPAWKVHTIGEGDRKHCVLYLDMPLLEDIYVKLMAPKACRLDDIDQAMETFEAGEEMTLRFSARKPWIRFWGIDADDLKPSTEIITTLKAQYIAAEDHDKKLKEPLLELQRQQDEWVQSQVPPAEKLVYYMDCFGHATTEEKSRAYHLDRTVIEHPDGVVAKEYADGGIAFGPGQSYWCHPRALHLEIENLQTYIDSGKTFKVTMMCSSPENLDWEYELTVKSGFKELEKHTQLWKIPKERGLQSVISFEIDPVELEMDALRIGLRSNQTAVLNDWFQNKGFIACLQALWITE